MATMTDGSELRLAAAELEDMEARIATVGITGLWEPGDELQLQKLLPRLLAAARRDLLAVQSRPKLNALALAAQAINPAITSENRNGICSVDLNKLSAGVQQAVEYAAAEGYRAALAG